MADHAHNLRAEFFRKNSRTPVGVITRGTTGTNRLRRFDRWFFHNERVNRLVKNCPTPGVIDLGYGASASTTVEWARWIKKLRDDAQVIGLEINPDRVLSPRDGVSFALGGFELAGHTPQIVRAFNVLRQYDVDQVRTAWETVTSRLAPGGIFFEGTCDELGRRCSWITLDAQGPQMLTLAWSPAEISTPSDIAERLPKVLIHRNVPGQRIYELLAAADMAWDHAAAWEPYGHRIRWQKARLELIELGWPIERERRGSRDSILTVPWSLVAP